MRKSDDRQLTLHKGELGTNPLETEAAALGTMTKAQLARYNARNLAAHEGAARALARIWDFLAGITLFPTWGLLPVRDAARILDVSPAVLRHRILCGEVPAVRIGAHWRIHRIEVLKRLVASWAQPFEPVRMGQRVIIGNSFARLLTYGTQPVRPLRQRTRAVAPP